jgi:hypothetical protein
LDNSYSGGSTEKLIPQSIDGKTTVILREALPRSFDDFRGSLFLFGLGGMDIKGFLDKTIDIDYHYQYNKASE